MVMVVLLLLLLAVLLYWWLKATDKQQSKKFIQWLGITGLIILLLFMLLRGAPIMAAIIGGISLVYVLVQRLMQVMFIAKTANKFFGKRKNPGKTSTTDMDVTEAREILEVSEHATKEEIMETYRKLMKKHHPDQGGTTYFAEKINRAKEVLLQHRDKFDNKD